MKRTRFIFLPLLFLGCTLNFVKDENLKKLDQKFEGVYTCVKDLDIGNDDVLRAGTRVRLYFLSGTNSVKVYAYPESEDREKTVGKNILYLFEADFPDSKFNEKTLEKKLHDMLRKIS